MISNLLIKAFGVALSFVGLCLVLAAFSIDTIGARIPTVWFVEAGVGLIVLIIGAAIVGEWYPPKNP